MTVIYDFGCNINMKFGLEKCNVINIKQGQYAACGRVSLSNEQQDSEVAELTESQSYKYLDIQELCRINKGEMKEKVINKME